MSPVRAAERHSVSSLYVEQCPLVHINEVSIHQIDPIPAHLPPNARLRLECYPQAETDDSLKTYSDSERPAKVRYPDFNRLRGLAVSDESPPVGPSFPCHAIHMPTDHRDFGKNSHEIQPFHRAF